MRVFEKLFTVRPNVSYCGNVAILGKQTSGLIAGRKSCFMRGADECRASPPAAAHRGQNPGRVLECDVNSIQFLTGVSHVFINPCSFVATLVFLNV